MPNLLTSLHTSANALSAFERVLTVSQNNVANASTPGYAAQRQPLEALSFEPDMGLLGGVQSGEIQTSRDLYAEQAVRREQESWGFWEQAAASLSAIEPIFDVSGEQGIAGAWNRLLQSFSAWSLSPGNATARQTVLDRAEGLAQSFQQTAAQLLDASTSIDSQMRATAGQINALGRTLQQYNLERRRGATDDAGLDTKIHAALEELSSLVNYTALFQEDGSVTVLLGGQSPLVVGDSVYEIRASFFTPANPPPAYPGAPPQAHILDSEGQDITAQIGGGRLGGLLYVRGTVLAALQGDGSQPGSLNRLAKAIADRVNGLLTAGNISDGPPAQPGVPLFEYDTSSDALAARSLRLDPSFTPDDLAPIDPGPPYVSNGIALKLAALASSQDSADRLDGFTYSEFYGSMAAEVGRALSEAQDAKDFRSQTAAQARNLRSQISGVNLDEEAVQLMQIQRAYQANAQMVTVLSDLTEIAVNLLR